MTYDVAVIGAGPAGSVAAMVLAATGRRVALVDQAPTRRKRVGESLTAAARPILQELELLDIVNAQGHLSCFGNVSAWGSAKLEMTDAIRDPQGLGWHLDRAAFDASLRDEAVRSGAELVQQRLKNVTETDDGFALNDGALQAKWLIEATGRSRWLTQKLGVTVERDDHLTACYAWQPCAPGDIDGRTLVESCSEGWWYTARLPDDTRVMVLHVDASFAKALRQRPERWHELLQRTLHIQVAVGHLNHDLEIRFADASTSRLHSWAGPRWIACGDAAISFDPIAAQGIFHALYSGLKAGQAVLAALMGQQVAIAAYAARLERIWMHHMAQQRLIYSLEQRWAREPFWLQRSLLVKRNQALDAVGTAAL